MADAVPTTATTEVPAHQQGAGFPPFKVETYPSQLFWLVITFGVLFVVLWRVAGPRINGVITLRRNTINDAIEAANKARGDAGTASAAYETALAGARARARSLAEETRQTMNTEFASAKAQADSAASAAMHEADAHIAEIRTRAQTHIAEAAREAAIAIVARLTGETVSSDDAAKAMGG
jgi:F-type H+-transporting ATPase subunit b